MKHFAQENIWAKRIEVGNKVIAWKTTPWETENEVGDEN
jgi:hypothetical protein